MEDIQKVRDIIERLSNISVEKYYKSLSKNKKDEIKVWSLPENYEKFILSMKKQEIDNLRKIEKELLQKYEDISDYDFENVKEIDTSWPITDLIGSSSKEDNSRHLAAFESYFGKRFGKSKKKKTKKKTKKSNKKPKKKSNKKSKKA